MLHLELWPYRLVILRSLSALRRSPVIFCTSTQRRCDEGSDAVCWYRR